MKSKPIFDSDIIEFIAISVTLVSTIFCTIRRLHGSPPLRFTWTFLAASLLLLAGQVSLYSQSHANAPGVIINEIPSPKSYSIYVPKPIYVSDPSILVLSNGDYLASHAQFGGASNSSNEGKTQIFRSSDKGQTWTKVNGGNNLNGILRGSLFEHNGVIYLSGSNHDSNGSKHVIMRSDDWGDTWDSQNFTAGGFATPDNLVSYDDRRWLASTTTSASFASNNDPFEEASWLKSGGFPALNESWLEDTFSTADNFIGEGQITASTTQGINILSKVRMLPYIAVSSVNPTNGRVSFDPEMDLINLRGGEKKISIRYDEISKKYYMLANPILPAHDNTSLAPDLVRNTAAVLSSQDLRRWRMEKIFLYSKNIDYEGFQYFNFDFDGDDIVLAARVAFNVGGNKPPRGHDSNLLTFHRIADFRNSQYDHVLRIEDGLVQRYETTGLSDAPLGNFPLGSQFDGNPLPNPNGIALHDDVIYVRESGGRVLAFDLMGNFLRIETNITTNFESNELEVPAPNSNQFSWIGLDSGDWAEPRNWFYYSLPQKEGSIATFGSAVNENTTVTVPTNDRSWHFDQESGTQEWTSVNVNNLAAGPQGLTGVTANQDPHIGRKNLNLDGNQVTQVRVRMRVDSSGSIPMNLYWANSTNNAMSATRSKQLIYNGNGEFQDLVFEMAQEPQWTDERITQLRVDPTNGSTYAGATFNIESVIIVTEDNATTLAGLKFNSEYSYTLTGGALRIENEDSTARIDVQNGIHEIEVPIDFKSNALFEISAGSELTLSNQVKNNGEINVNGAGVLSITGYGQIASLNISSSAKVSLGPIEFDAEGTIEISSQATLQLLEETVYPILELSINGEQKRQGTWGGIGSGADNESENIIGLGILNVTTGPSSAYAEWVNSMGLSNSEDLYDYWQDPDGDGVINIFEWFLGGHPLDGMSRVKLPIIEHLEDSIQFQFTCNKDAGSELKAIFQYSETLNEPWWELIIQDDAGDSTNSEINVEVASVDDLTDTVKIIIPLSNESYRQLFMRLKLSDIETEDL
ncbi:hypothetical protein ACWPKO_05640 [Coraliomargarita sp. W4R53]